MYYLGLYFQLFLFVVLEFNIVFGKLKPSLIFNNLFVTNFDMFLSKIYKIIAKSLMFRNFIRITWYCCYYHYHYCTLRVPLSGTFQLGDLSFGSGKLFCFFFSIPFSYSYYLMIRNDS